MERRVPAMLLGAAGALAAPGLARAQAAPSYLTVDLPALDAISFDRIVSCPLATAAYVSGGFEGCPTGRAPDVGECGLTTSCGNGLSVPDAVTWIDHEWAHLYQLPMVFALAAPSDTVFVFNAADHGPFPEEGVEWTVWGSDTPDATGFPSGWTLASFCAVFKQGWVETGACPGDDADDSTGMFAFPRPFAYVAIYANYSITIFADAAHTTWSASGDDDPATPGWQSSEAELDAVAAPAVPRPVAIAGPDRRLCEGGTARLDGTVSTGAILRHAWDTDGDGFPDQTGPSVTLPFPVAGTYTVTLFVIGECGCSVDDVTIEVVPCVLSVRFESASAHRVASGGAEVRWTTLEERDTNVFLVERADRPEGPFSALGAPVDAMGPGHAYSVVDPSPAPWYRVVELTSAGRGDATEPFTIGEPVWEAGSGAPACVRRR